MQELIKKKEEGKNYELSLEDIKEAKEEILSRFVYSFCMDW